jgi:TorA maturation chaperone TorD
MLTEQLPDRELAQAREAVYGFLLTALDVPSPAQHAWFASPGFRLGLEELCERFDLDAPPGDLAAEDADDHQARYLACFEVGLPTPPVVLLASHYDRREPVPAVIHEHLLFYRRFGAMLAPGNREPADHLRNEVAFLMHLDGLLCSGKIERGSVLHARRDFLRRQVARWPARAAQEAEEKHLPAVYHCLLALLAAAVAQDLALSEAAVTLLQQEHP